MLSYDQINTRVCEIIKKYELYCKGPRLENIKNFDRMNIEYAISVTNITYFDKFFNDTNNDIKFKKELFAKIHEIIMYYDMYLDKYGFFFRLKGYNNIRISYINNIKTLNNILKSYNYERRESFIMVSSSLHNYYTTNINAYISHIEILFSNQDYAKSLCEFI